MKKLLGVSIVAMLAVMPMMAHAAGIAPTAATTSSDPYLGVNVATTDQGHIASTAYVKGAYNAAIGAVNDLSTKKQDNLKNSAEGHAAITGFVQTSVRANGTADDTSLVTEKAVRDAIDAVSSSVSASAGDGLSYDTTTNKFSADLDTAAGLGFDTTSGNGAKKIQVKTASNKGLTFDGGALAVVVDTATMKLDANGVGIKDAGVDSAQLKNGAVTADKLASDAVTNTKIAANAVTAAKLDTDAVETAKIKNLNVTTAKLDTGAVTADKLASNAVTTDKIADNAVTYAKLGSGFVQSSVRSSVATDADGYDAWNSGQTVASEKAVATAISTATTGMATQSGVNSAIAASSVSVTSATVPIYKAWGDDDPETGTTTVNASVSVSFTAGTYPNN